MRDVVAALLWKDGRFLIAQRPEGKKFGGLWEFVGGKVEPGESREKAIVRECQEELGITVQPVELYMELTHAYPDFTVHLTIFTCTVTEGEPQRLEHMDMRWIRPEEYTAYTFCPADYPILERLAGTPSKK